MPETEKHRNTEALKLSNEELKRLTRENIRNALIILMKEKDYSEISVSELVKKAGVSRTAYYRNFTSKDDVLDYYLESAAAVICSAVVEYDYDTDKYNFWLTLFQSIAPYAESFKLLFKNEFRYKIEESLRELMLGDHDVITKSDMYTECVRCGAVCSVIKQWIDDDLEPPPEDMAEICCKIGEKSESLKCADITTENESERTVTSL